MPIDMIIAGGPRYGDDSQTLAERGFVWRERAGVRALVCEPLEHAGFANAFSTRLGGVSPYPSEDLNLAGSGEDTDANIAENRRRFLALFPGAYRLAVVWQVHGDSIRIVENADEAADIANERADGLASSLPAMLLGIKTADCVPVLLGDPATGAFAAVHAGWRGTADSIVRKAVELMQARFGSRAEDLVCAIGPSASCRTYEIGADVIDAFDSAFPGHQLIRTSRPGHGYIDLPKSNLEQLAAAGVPKASIYNSDLCTLERTDLFFSYRKEKSLHGKTGRLMSVIGRMPPR